MHGLIALLGYRSVEIKILDSRMKHFGTINRCPDQSKACRHNDSAVAHKLHSSQLTAFTLKSMIFLSPYVTITSSSEKMDGDTTARYYVTMRLMHKMYR